MELVKRPLGDEFNKYSTFLHFNGDEILNIIFTRFIWASHS